VAPFAAYVLCLAAQQVFPGSQTAWLAARVVLTLACFVVFSRPYLVWRPARPAWSVLVGLAVFVIWIGPDLLWHGYRTHWILQNTATGAGQSTLPHGLRADWWFLALRITASVALVPPAEELFWRGWLMRWLVRPDFQSVPLGAYTHSAFWITAILFASEHGAYWDVGLAAGIVYNWWLMRTRNLADCILAHAITNACLAVYVIGWNRWAYWL
jgi:CAAX prenyl protease-like protein